MVGSAPVHVPLIEPGDRDDGLHPVIDDDPDHLKAILPNPEDTCYVRAVLRFEKLFQRVRSSYWRMTSHYEQGHFVRARNVADSALAELEEATNQVRSLRDAFDAAARRSPKGPNMRAMSERRAA